MLPKTTEKPPQKAFDYPPDYERVEFVDETSGEVKLIPQWRIHGNFIKPRNPKRKKFDYAADSQWLNDAKNGRKRDLCFDSLVNKFDYLVQSGECREIILYDNRPDIAYAPDFKERMVMRYINGVITVNLLKTQPNFRQSIIKYYRQKIQSKKPV